MKFRFPFALHISLLMMALSGFAQERPDNGRLLEFYQSQQFREAASYIQSFHPDTVSDAAVIGMLGYCYRMAGDYAQAEGYYLRLYALDSLRVGTLINLATVNARRKQYQSAMAYYQRVLAIDSLHISTYDAIAGISFAQGDIEGAFGYLARANAIQPANGNIAHFLVQVCMKLDRYALADSVLQVALLADPHHGGLLLGKLQVADKLKQYPEMVRVGELLAGQGDESLEVSMLLARGYFFTDDHKACKKVYEGAFERHGRLWEIDYYYLAMSCKAMGQYAEGIVWMDKVLELAISSNTALYLGRKADLHDLANQPSASASTYLRSFHFERIPLHYYSLAVLYDRKLSDPRNALRYYRLYLKQNPPKEERVYADYVQRRIKELE